MSSIDSTPDERTELISEEEPQQEAAAGSTFIGRTPPVLRQKSSSSSFVGAIGPPGENADGSPAEDTSIETTDEGRPQSSSRRLGTELLQRRWRTARRREMEQKRQAARAGASDPNKERLRIGEDATDGDAWSDGLVGLAVCCMVSLAMVAWVVLSLGTIAYGLLWWQNATVAEVVDEFHRTRSKNLGLTQPSPPSLPPWNYGKMI